MKPYRKVKNSIVIVIVFALVILLVPMQASGEVKPITELKEQLGSISEEEKAVLEELFTLGQEIDSLEQEEAVITGEINDLQKQTDDLQLEIGEKQVDYDMQLDILKQVLVSYQRGGPASSLEILLNADDLSSFLKSFNIMKDISHNVNELLASLEAGKKILQEERDRLSEDKALLKAKEEELLTNLHIKQGLQEEQENYLASLQEDRAYYQEQLDNVSLMWDYCKKLFPGISEEISGIIGAGYFTLEDLNLEYGFFAVSGYLKEETFNRILSENSKLPATTFSFEDGLVVIEVPDEQLVLTGNFVISDESAIQFVAEGGTFYDMPLETGSIEELFLNGPLKIDFQAVTEDMAIMDFKIKEVESLEGTLNFVIIPQF